jgi:ABC-type antimicrobial peptide transport system permease subunit
LLAVIRNVVQSQDKSVAKFTAATVEERLGEAAAERSFDTSLLSLFSLVALFLAGLGIYGLIHHSVVQQSHEIGVRVALGATRLCILTLILRQGVTLCAIGVAAGLLGALGLTKVLASLLYAVTPTDPLVFLLAPVILLVLAMMACWMPANRAAHIDPSTALRQD